MKDNEILALISSSKIELNNPSFEDQCMRFIQEQTDIDKSYSAFRKRSFLFYILAVLICLALVFLSLILYRGDLMYAVLLQSFAVGMACFIITTIKERTSIPL